MKQMIRVRVTCTGNSKVLLERYISRPISEIPFSSIVDALDCIFEATPHTIDFIFDSVKSID